MTTQKMPQSLNQIRRELHQSGKLRDACARFKNIYNGDIHVSPLLWDAKTKYKWILEYLDEGSNNLKRCILGLFNADAPKRWEFYDAPPHIKNFFPENGGDEDFIVFAPNKSNQGHVRKLLEIETRGSGGYGFDYQMVTELGIFYLRCHA